jgi:sterol desaturase/sphingolipid hydroxylase (fatty acid hydroxylase superfamily)
MVTFSSRKEAAEVSDWVLAHEPQVRIAFFLGILVLMALWEIAAPRRPLTVSKGSRWGNNLGLVLIDTLALRFLLPANAVTTAVLIQQHGWGILNNLSISCGLAVVLGVAVLDLTIYLQHAMFHAIPTLWRLHRVHHTDLDFDVTTGVRFHPIEILLSMGIKMGAVTLLGASPLAVILFEVLLNGTSLFNHGNVHLPRPMDRILRLVVVTPEMHRVHHSVVIQEHNSNFGFNFPWWDRFFGTYRDQPAAGHLAMTIGLAPFREPQRLTLLRLLILPFIAKPTQYPFYRRPDA